jgi:hypothetical protein
VTGTEPRKGMPERRLQKDEFLRRFQEQFQGPAFNEIGPQLQEVSQAAWQEYKAHRKNSHTQSIKRTAKIRTRKRLGQSLLILTMIWRQSGVLLANQCLQRKLGITTQLVLIASY